MILNIKQIGSSGNRPIGLSGNLVGGGFHMQFCTGIPTLKLADGL